MLRFLFAISLFSGIVLAGGMIWILDVVDLDHEQALDSIVDHTERDNTLIYARDGKMIAEVFSRYRIYVPWEEMPAMMIDAVLAIEDRNFFTHRGVDIKAMLRALWSNVKAGRVKQGASTITQQVVKNYSLNRKRTLQRKLKEIFLAVELERILPKEKILTIYLNNFFLGNRSYGVGAAARRYFGKKVQNLTLAETALIAGMFRAPGKYDPLRFPRAARRRQLQVLQAMAASGKIDSAQMHTAAREDLRFHPYRAPRLETAPHFVDYVIKKAATILDWPTIGDQGLRIHTTLDLDSQRQATKTIADVAKITKYKEVAAMEAALLSVDPLNGEILTMVGGRDYRQSKFNRTVQALRPPGSAFKPIVYSYALARGMTWNDVSLLAPISIEAYRPRERRGEFIKETTLYRSFYKSLNLPVIDLAKKFGVKRIIEHAQQLGIESQLKEEAGTVLGGSDLRMTEMAAAYAVFANAGVRTWQIAIRKITDRHGNVLYRAPAREERQAEVLSPQVSYMMTAAMQDVFRHGTASRYRNMHRWAAGKTGTSDGAKDNWFCGYSNERVTVVWVGKDDFSQNSRRTYGATVALPLWAKFMQAVTSPHARRGFAVPTGVVAARVNPRYGTLDAKGIRMYFPASKVPKKRYSPYEALSKNPEFRGFFKWN